MVVTFRDPEPGGGEGAGDEDAAMQAFELDSKHESHKEKKARLDRTVTMDVELEQHRHGNW